MRPLKRGEIILLLKLSVMKVFIISIFYIVIGCLSGCKTGGSWVKSTSPNVKVISPNDLIKNPNGTYGLDKGNVLPKKNKVTSGGDNTIKPREIVNITMNVIPKNDNSGGKVDKSPDTVIINEDKMKIDWAGLTLFYLIAIMVLILSWMVYDLIKDFIYNKKRSRNPFTGREKNDEIKNTTNSSKKRKREQRKQ